MHLLSILRITLTLMIGIAMSSQAVAVVLHVDNGQLMGASDIIIGDTHYDVAFVDGTCEDVFGVCDTSSFTFNDPVSATLASYALLGQVFMGPGVYYFNNQEEINGISGYNHADLITAYNTNPDGTVDMQMLHLDSYNVDLIQILSITNHPPIDSSDDPYNVYAVWSESHMVPEPVSLLLMVIGLAGLGISSKKRL